MPNGGVQQNTTTLGGSAAAAQILVQPSSGDVTVTGLTVDGNGNNVQTCGLQLIGIYFRNAGGTISKNAVKNQLLPEGYQGCQSGLGIYVQNANAGVDPVNITSNTVTNFDKNGITMNEANATGSITKNTVVGLGPTDVIAQNGIEVAFGANADIESNNVSNLIYTPETYGSSGILLYGTDQSTSVLNRNTVNSAQYGIVMEDVNGTSTNLVPVTGNKVSNSAFAGVGLYSLGGSNDWINVASNTIQNTTEFDGIDACSNNNTITGNKVTSSYEAAIHLDGLCDSPSGTGNTVTGNKITIACVGILSGPSDPNANTIGTNKYADVQQQIVYGSDSASCSGAVRVPPRHQRSHKHKGLPVAVRPVR